MPRATARRVLRKFDRLHDRLGGSDRAVTFLKFTNAVGDEYTDSAVTIEETTLTHPAVIKDQSSLYSGKIGEEMALSFPGGISSDERIFIFVADSFQERNPTSTLSQRCEDFLYARKGQDRGGIKYGNTIYTIERIFTRPILGTVAARYFVLARAQKTVGS